MSEANTPSTTASATSDREAVPQRTATQSSSPYAPYSGTSSLPAPSVGISAVTHATSAVLSGFVSWGILQALPALISAQAWTQLYVALGALAIVGAPSSALPLLHRVADRFLGPGPKQ